MRSAELWGSKREGPLRWCRADGSLNREDVLGEGVVWRRSGDAEAPVTELADGSGVSQS
jgi:hypothetical protein